MIHKHSVIFDAVSVIGAVVRLTDWLHIVMVVKFYSAGFCCIIHRTLQPDYEYYFVVSEDTTDSR
jgi:hypothetical protein